MPHFHIEGSGFRCSVAIATRQVIIGVVPRKVELAALEWVSDRQAELLATWQELNP